MMEKYIVKIQSLDNITHDVVRIVTSKPNNYQFIPGQATEIAINKEGWQDKARPFTFTSLPEDNYLEFTIKTYPSHKGVTNEFLSLKKSDELILHDVFGAITYKGEGLFIAAGAGVTPFISIFRNLNSQHKVGKNVLLFANKLKIDIILENEFDELLGDAFINILSDEKLNGYQYGRITENTIKTIVTDFSQQFYVCGPPPMMDAVLKQLKDLGVGNNAVTVEM